MEREAGNGYGDGGMDCTFPRLKLGYRVAMLKPKTLSQFPLCPPKPTPEALQLRAGQDRGIVTLLWMAAR